MSPRTPRRRGGYMAFGEVVLQPEHLRRAGFLLGLTENPEVHARVTAFRQGLEAIGWMEGRNIRIDYRFAGGDPERVRAYVAELVASGFFNTIDPKRSFTSGWALGLPDLPDVVGDCVLVYHFFPSAISRHLCIMG
jgi:hypothetical protein